VADIDSAIEELYARPLDQFTPARNELAKALRAAGDKEASELIKALRKPTVGAWVINQVARAHPGTIAKLFDIGDRLGTATRAVMRGQGSATKVREIAAEERTLIADLVKAAVELLEENGHPATASNRERIADTLAATASDDAVRKAVEQRRLAADARRVGLGDGSPDLHVVDAGTDEEEQAPREDVQRTRRRERLEQKLHALREEADRLEAEAEEAAASAKAVAREADRAAKQAERARDAADRVARRAAQTEAELERL